MGKPQGRGKVKTSKYRNGRRAPNSWM